LTAADEFWHELVLHGIGGRTIEEAKERMSWQEAFSWRVYIAKRGGLNFNESLERGVAGIAALIVNRTGGRAKVSDFLIHYGRSVEDEDEGDATLEDIMSILRGAKH
jgi:hypothetical protein